MEAGMKAPLWRAIAIFRFASLGYAAVLLWLDRAFYSHWNWGWAVLAGMTGWTIVSSIGFARPARRTPVLLSADLCVTMAALLSTALIQKPTASAHGVMPVTATWVAGPALAWAVARGAGSGAAVTVVISVGVVWLRHYTAHGQAPASPLSVPVTIMLAAVVMGYVATLIGRAERAMQQATQIEAASRERERLARSIHDSVLQVLAMVQRRGAEAGGTAAEIGRLAGEQEKALRALVIGDGEVPPPAGERDLSAELALLSSAEVSVITPAQPVLLAESTVSETAAAVRAALDNVRQHCGDSAKAWVLIDDEGEAVSVTIRDDGPGMADGRLAEAAAEGRLGVSQAIKGRMRHVGGSAEIESTPGTGTEVRLRLPRVMAVTP